MQAEYKALWILSVYFEIDLSCFAYFIQFVLRVNQDLFSCTFQVRNVDLLMNYHIFNVEFSLEIFICANNIVVHWTWSVVQINSCMPELGVRDFPFWFLDLDLSIVSRFDLGDFACCMYFSLTLEVQHSCVITFYVFSPRF